jgi:hypothetical protein
MQDKIKSLVLNLRFSLISNYSRAEVSVKSGKFLKFGNEEHFSFNSIDHFTNIFCEGAILSDRSRPFADSMEANQHVEFSGYLSGRV